jgi:hypothetical protein
VNRRLRLPGAGRTARVAAIILVALLAAWGGYVVVGNWYIRNRLHARLNENPSSFTADWSHAETWWPGRLSATDVRLVKQSAAVQWEMRLDAGSASFGMIPLLFQHLNVSRMRGDGFALRVRFVPGDTPGAEAGSPFAPPIEGLPEPPLKPPKGPKPPPVPPGDRWTYRFRNLDVGGVRETWIGPFRLTGGGRVATSMSFTPDVSIAVSDFRFDVGSGTVHVGDDVLASNLEAKVTVGLDRFDMRKRPVIEVFDEMSATVKAHAALHDVQLPRTSFPRIPWLGFGGGLGDADLDLVMKNGAFAPGTAMKIEATDFSVAYPGYLVQGDAVVEGDVARGAGPATGRARATFRKFTIKKDGAPSAHVRGEGFTAELKTTDLTIHDPLETFEVDMTLPDSEIVDFSAYDDTIPKPLRVHVEGGRGTISGNVAITQDGGHGALGIDGHDIRLQQGDDVVTLDMLLAARIPVLDFQQGRYDFSGTELHVKNARIASGSSERWDGWWGDFTLEKLAMQKGGHPLADMELSGKFRDTRPMVALIARDRPLLKLVRPVLVAPNVTMSARMKAGPQLVELDDLTMKGDKLDLRACVDARGPDARGVFWIDGGMLSAGYKFMNGKRNFKPFAGAPWYEQMAPLCEDPTHLPPD